MNMRYLACAEMHNQERIFIKVFSPLLWTKDISECKLYDTIDECRSHLQSIDEHLENFIRGQSDIYYGIFIVGINIKGELTNIECYI